MTCTPSRVASYTDSAVVEFSPSMVVDLFRFACPRDATDIAPAQLRTLEGVTVGSARVDAVDGLSLATITAPAPGLYQLDVSWPETLPGDPPTQSRFVHVAEKRTVQFTDVTFIDRMDTCVTGPYRTTSGTTVCARAGGVFAYAADGSLLRTWPGTQVVARGDSIWTWGGTADPDEVVLRNGTGDVVGSGAVGHGGLITPTSVTGLVTVAGKVVVRTLTLAAGAVAMTEDALPFPGAMPVQPTTSPFIVVGRNDTNWWLNACRLTEGCPSAPGQCPVDNRCPPALSVFGYLVEGDAVWGSPQYTFWPRPLSADLLTEPRAAGSILYRAIATPLPKNEFEAAAAAPGYLLHEDFVADRYATVRRDGEREVFTVLAFDAVPTTMLTHTREFLVIQRDPIDPFTLRFVSNP